MIMPRHGQKKAEDHDNDQGQERGVREIFPLRL